jgi:hypothetical protein
MRSQDQSSDTNQRGTAAGTGGSRTRRGARVRAAGPAAAIAMNHALASRSPQAVLALQRAAGNAAVAQLAEQEQHVHDAGCAHQQRPVQRSGVDQVLRSPGTPMAGPVRRDMEARLGADFSDVRLHHDASARRSAAELGARAFTSGSHVVLGAGGGDSRTLAHELIHVVQQRRGPVAGTDNGGGLKVSDPSDRFEREAEAGAVRAMSAPAPARTRGGPAAVQRAAAVVQRAPGGALRTARPEELDLMPGAARHEMGGDSGFKKYALASMGSDREPLPLYRAMGKQEFDALRAGALPQGSSFQGFSPTRGYSEGYITGKDGSPTHLVEFYRPNLVGPGGRSVPDLNAALKVAGAPEKSEKKILSTGIGLAARWDPKVLANTRKNEAREKKIGELTANLNTAKDDVANAKSDRVRALKEKHQVKTESALDAAMAEAPASPAKEDPVKILNRGLKEGTYAWRLVGFKTTV